MTVSALDTAKLPRSPSAAPAGTPRGHREPSASPGLELSDVATAVPPPGAGRRALREERRHLRRQQRRYAMAGIAVLAAMFLVTVIVLGGLR